MEVIPAIDIKGGKCVRLYQGDFTKETVFSEDPVAMARHWESQGAKRLHIVDLDGAARGEPVNTEIITEIVRAVKVPLQVGGGIRTLESVYKLLALGIQRVILGTAAIEEPELVEKACQRFGEGIIIGIDARNGHVATRGWKETTEVEATDLAEQMVALGAKRIIYTDISRDGTMTEPDFAAIEELIKQVKVPVIASGGISSPDHLKRLAALGAEGAIVGRALYEGKVKLGEALV